MSSIELSASADLDVPAAAAYAILADYRDGHPRVLPKPPFVGLTVESGGVGAGTVFWCEMRVAGRTRGFRATVSEPEPGRVLVETDRESGLVTTFTVDSLGSGRRSRVTIATRAPWPGGIVGAVGRWVMRRFLIGTYHRELRLLEEVARAHAASAAAG